MRVRWCRQYWYGVVGVSAGHEYVCGTRGLCIVSSTADVLGISRMRGVSDVCVMCICLALGSVGGEWIRGLGLGLGLTNPVGTGGVLDVYLCLGCGCVGGKYVEDLDMSLERCGVVIYV